MRLRFSSGGMRFQREVRRVSQRPFSGKQFRADGCENRSGRVARVIARAHYEHQVESLRWPA
jgi:hypothetical protein